MKSLSKASEQLDFELQQRGGLPQPDSLVNARSDWASLVFAEAMKSGSPDLDEKEIKAGLELVKRPVFIGGNPRSGTTYLRNLLDGNAQLCCIPLEIQYYEFLRKSIRKLDEEETFHRLCLNWLQKLADPMNQPPYWTLSMGQPLPGPYLEFVRYSQSWWKICCNFPVENEYHRHVIPFILAFASVIGNGKIHPGYRYWLEKTPGIEAYYEPLKREFPEALFIMTIRNPSDSFLSAKKSLFRSLSKSSLGLSYYLNTQLRFKTITMAQHSTDSLIITFEELTEHTESCIQRVLTHIGFKSGDISLIQTVNGQVAHINSSYQSSDEKKPELSFIEIAWLAAISKGTVIATQYPIHKPWRYYLLRPFLLILLAAYKIRSQLLN